MWEAGVFVMESPTQDSILKAVEALNNAKVPTEGRAGYMVMNDGSIKMFGPITDKYVPVDNKPSNVKIHKVK
jgi:hypothetical protein